MAQSLKRRWIIVSLVILVLLGGVTLWKVLSVNEEDKVVYVFSNDCGYCSSFKPTFEKVMLDYPEWHVEKLDVNISQQLKEAQDLGAVATPTVFIVRANQVVDTLEGEVPEKSFRKFMEKNTDNSIKEVESMNSQ